MQENQFVLLAMVLPRLSKTITQLFKSNQKPLEKSTHRPVGREFHDDFLSRNLHFNGLLLRYVFH